MRVTVFVPPMISEPAAADRAQAHAAARAGHRHADAVEDLAADNQRTAAGGVQGHGLGVGAAVDAARERQGAAGDRNAQVAAGHGHELRVDELRAAGGADHRRAALVVHLERAAEAPEPMV